MGYKLFCKSVAIKYLLQNHQQSTINNKINETKEKNLKNHQTQWQNRAF